MRPAVVSDRLVVGELPGLEEIKALAEAGFKSIITNQPDGEIERVLASTAVGIEAVRHGLVHVYAPISSRTPSASELATFEQALGELPAPIYACCYSGARSAAAAAMLQTAMTDVDAIIAAFSIAGHDVAALRPWLEDERHRRRGG